MTKDLKSFIENETKRISSKRKKLEIEMDKDLRLQTKKNIEDKIDLLCDFERLKGQAQAFKMIIDFIETNEKK